MASPGNFYRKKVALPQGTNPLPKLGLRNIDGHGLHAALQPAVALMHALDGSVQVAPDGLAVG